MRPVNHFFYRMWRSTTGMPPQEMSAYRLRESTVAPFGAGVLLVGVQSLASFSSNIPVILGTSGSNLVLLVPRRLSSTVPTYVIPVRRITAITSDASSATIALDNGCRILLRTSDGEALKKLANGVPPTPTSTRRAHFQGSTTHLETEHQRRPALRVMRYMTLLAFAVGSLLYVVGAVAFALGITIGTLGTNWMLFYRTHLDERLRVSATHPRGSHYIPLAVMGSLNVVVGVVIFFLGATIRDGVAQFFASVAAAVLLDSTAVAAVVAFIQPQHPPTGSEWRAR